MCVGRQTETRGSPCIITGAAGSDQARGRRGTPLVHGRKGENPKLQPKFVGPYEVLAAWGNHTYRIERQGQESVQHESRLKPYRACTEPLGQAPGTLEATRRPNMRGAVAHTRQKASPPELVEELPLPTVQKEPKEAENVPARPRNAEEGPPTRVDSPQPSTCTGTPTTPQHHPPPSPEELPAGPQRS